MGSRRRATRAGIATMEDFLASPVHDMVFGEVAAPAERGGGLLPAFTLKFPRGTAALFGRREDDKVHMKIGLKEVGPVAVIILSFRVSHCPRTFAMLVNYHGGEARECRPFERLAEVGRYAVVALEDSPRPIWIRDYPTNRSNYILLAKKLDAMPAWTEEEFEAAVATCREEDVVREMWMWG